MSELQKADPSSHHSLGRFWTIPNILSISRFFIAIPITYLILMDGDIVWILTLIGIAVSTDWLDGVIARWSKSVSEWGKILDPIADKFAASMVVLALVIQEKLPVWFLLVIFVRDILILLGGAIAAHRLRLVLMSMWWGKVAVFMLSLTVLWALLEADRPVFQISLWVTTVLFIYSFVLYVIRFFHVMTSGASAESEEDLAESEASSAYQIDSVESES